MSFKNWLVSITYTGKMFRIYEVTDENDVTCESCDRVIPTGQTVSYEVDEDDNDVLYTPYCHDCDSEDIVAEVITEAHNQAREILKKGRRQKRLKDIKKEI